MKVGRSDYKKKIPKGDPRENITIYIQLYVPILILYM